MDITIAQLDRTLPRSRWKYHGRQIIEGRECHTWTREIPAPDPATGYNKLGYAHSVGTFWDGVHYATRQTQR